MNLRINVLWNNAIYWGWFALVIWLFIGLFAAGFFHLAYIADPPAYFIEEFEGNSIAARWMSVFAAPIFFCLAFMWFAWAKTKDQYMRERFLV